MPIKPGPSENEQEFIGRCMSVETKDYPQDQAYAICKSKWDRKELSEQKFSDPQKRVQQRIKGIYLDATIKGAYEFAPQGEGKAFPWDECVAKMIDEYGDEETANKVCGMIKSKYGS